MQMRLTVTPGTSTYLFLCQSLSTAITARHDYKTTLLLDVILWKKIFSDEIDTCTHAHAWMGVTWKTAHASTDVFNFLSLPLCCVLSWSTMGTGLERTCTLSPSAPPTGSAEEASYSHTACWDTEVLWICNLQCAPVYTSHLNNNNDVSFHAVCL